MSLSALPAFATVNQSFDKSNEKGREYHLIFYRYGSIFNVHKGIVYDPILNIAF